MSLEGKLREMEELVAQAEVMVARSALWHTLAKEIARRCPELVDDVLEEFRQKLRSAGSQGLEGMAPGAGGTMQDAISEFIAETRGLEDSA